MSVSYSIAEYTGLACGAGLGGLILILTTGIWIMRKITPRCKNIVQVFSLLLIPACATIAWCLWLIPIFEQIGDLLIPSEYALRTTAGQIQTVTEPDTEIYHLRSGKLLGGEQITIDDKVYYVISEGTLAEGMWVEIQYAQFENNVILSWQETTQEQAGQILEKSVLSEPQMPTEKSRREPTPLAQLIGWGILWLGLLGFIATVIAATFFHNKIAAKLLRQDASLNGQIKPNRYALLWRIMPMIFLCFMILGAIIGSAEYHVLVLVVIGIGGMAGLMAVDATTNVRLDGSTVIIRRLGKENHYRFNEIRAVFWRNNRGMIGKTMVLVVDSGKTYWFSMDVFAGVENTYQYINRYLENRQQ